MSDTQNVDIIERNIYYFVTGHVVYLLNNPDEILPDGTKNPNVRMGEIYVNTFIKGKDQLGPKGVITAKGAIEKEFNSKKETWDAELVQSSIINIIPLGWFSDEEWNESINEVGEVHADKQ